MRLFHFSTIAMAGLLAFACTVPQHIDLGPAADAGPVECDSGCVIEWQRAQLWIDRHSKMKIQTATDVIVQTFNPSSSGGPAYGFTAQKTPLGSLRYRITVEPQCVKALIGCTETPEDLAAAFYYFVATGADVLQGKELWNVR